MTQPDGEPAKDLFVYNGGFLTDRVVRRILHLAGWNIRLGLPGEGDWVGVWGASPTAPRGNKVAGLRNAPVLRVEDAFLRSVLPGRAGEAPAGLVLDRRGLHFDPRQPSDLEVLLAEHPLDDTVLLDRARRAIERIGYWQLGKYNDVDPAAELPQAPYVLVIDQLCNDASVTASGADAALFREMLVFAQTEHPGLPIIIKGHPEARLGYRESFFSAADNSDRVTYYDAAAPSWDLFQGAAGVYTVSSTLGFEAIFAGHKPRVFGQPFYAGWGLTNDETPLPRRKRQLTKAQLFAAAMILYPTWYDPHTDSLCELENVIDSLAARKEANALDRQGYVAAGIRPWKRRHMQAIFGARGKLRFHADLGRAQRAAAATGRRVMVWGAASKAGPEAPIVRVEDGFLRSRGLGAELVPPLSLVADDIGIYYDATRPSRLEALITQSVSLPQAERQRAARLLAAIRAGGVSKYNLAGSAPADLPTDRPVILVPGQVEDDASIRLGTGEIATNLAAVKATRRANPDAFIVYKPHPDAEAGLRDGGDLAAIAKIADRIAAGADPIGLLDQVTSVWTMTSTLGLEALIRRCNVTCLGTPFYSGWGLTTDHGPALLRRRARPDIVALTHAVLIGYPRYFDPVAGQICSPEVALARLTDPQFDNYGQSAFRAAMQKVLRRLR